MHHRHVSTEWSTPGYFGHATCVCCGFDMLGQNRVLTVTHRTGRTSATLCDGCVNAIAKEADGREFRMDGTEYGMPFIES